MSTTAIALVLLSTFIHVGWNLLGKREHPSAAFLLLANTLGCLFLLPAFIPYGQVVADFTLPVWGWLIITGLFQALMYAALAGAYRHGDMSVAYPLASAMPVLFVTGFNLLLGHSSQLTSKALAGMALAVLGGLLLPLEHCTDFSKYRPRLFIFLAILAALGTTGYSLIDAYALQLLRDTPNLSVSGMAATVIYSFFEGITSSIWLAGYVFWNKSERDSLHEVLAGYLPQATVAGLGIFLAYTLILIAMGFVRNVSYVVAFRQLSVPLGTWVGVYLLGEPRYRPKLIGAGVMFTGLVLVGLG